jgi:hypothetical protein
MAKLPGIFSRIRSRITKAGKPAKFATPKFGVDLSNLVPAPPSLLQRLGIKSGFVEGGKRPSVRSAIVTKPALSKAKLESEEGRPLSRPEVKRIRGARRYTKAYLNQKLRFDPRLTDPSLYHPGYWNLTESFQQNWMRDHRRFLQLVQDRTGFHYELEPTGEWIKTEAPGASRKVMSQNDWHFYTHHYFANQDLYAGIGPELLELPPGEVSPRTIRRVRSPGRANQTGRSQGSYRTSRRRAA